MIALRSLRNIIFSDVKSKSSLLQILNSGLKGGSEASYWIPIYESQIGREEGGTNEFGTNTQNMHYIDGFHEALILFS